MHIIKTLTSSREKSKLINLFSQALPELGAVPPHLLNLAKVGTVKSFTQSLKLDCMVVLLAKIESKIIGFFVAFIKTEEQFFSCIKYAYVLPEFRNKGICSEFISFFEKNYELIDTVMCSSSKFDLWKKRGFAYLLLGLNEEIIEHFERYGVLTCFLSKTDMSNTGSPLLSLDFLELNKLNPYHLNNLNRSEVMEFFEKYGVLQNNK